jgi:4-diphosphocytidyl-2-C-methyl-D-erythritol kinase
MSVRVFAPAKINLTLEVGRPRADGMHPLQSVVTFADVGDIIEAEAAETLSLKIVGDFADQLSEGDRDNLVLRAARALAAAANVSAGAKLTLQKDLPVASGIGGGSADAAATLRALNTLWGAGLDDTALQAIARTLGSDVPVCVFGAPAYMTGVGETFAPMRAPSFSAVLVNPLTPLATPSVYREFDRQHLGGAFTEALSTIAALDNDLEAPAVALMPDIGVIGEILRNDARVLHAGLSGSGATMFALTTDFAASESLAADIRAAHPDWWAIETELAGA